MATLREPDAAPAGAIGPAPTRHDPTLCAICHARPRAGRGALTRCVPCIKAQAERDRQDRAAAEALVAARLAATTKVCRSCKRSKSFDAFAPNKTAKDGRRCDCRACVAAGRAGTKQRTPEQKKRRAELNKQPHRRAGILASVYRWRAANPDAIAAHAAVDKAMCKGDLVPAKMCQAEGCRRRKSLHSHHNSYAASQRTRVLWLCRDHHGAVHTGRPVPLKKSAHCKFAKAPKAA
jgi:hypothetical protein